jgi:hypothetical protein
MSAIYSVILASGANPGSLSQQWQSGTGLASGYTSLVPVQVGARLLLFAFNSATQQLDSYVLTGADPWVQKVASVGKLSSGPWDMLNTFVFGNTPYLLTYRVKTGNFGFFAVADDLSLSPPYIFSASHTTPSDGFTTVAPYTSLSAQYILGYDTTTGRVENFSVTVVPSSAGGTPPLLAVNIWYHFWAPNWKQFAFFQLGGCTFFFKINVSVDKTTNQPKLQNVNIDHMQDNPAMGSIEVGSQLQSQLPYAASITAAAIIPWPFGKPYLFTYISSTGAAAVYEIHSDCLGWTQQISQTITKGASLVVSYRVGNSSYVLLYQPPAPGQSQ